MKKFLLISILFLPFISLAQETPEGVSPDTLPSLNQGGPTGNIACFDYYKFGSVQADLQTNLAQTVPGVTLAFTGKIVNDNEYPLVDGKLTVKIFRRDEGTFGQGNGNPIVDQITVAENVNLSAKGSKDASFEWKVPADARGGEYYAAYFFTTSGRYNLMGLSFTDDVVGNQAPFTVTNPEDPKTVYLNKNGVTLNDRPVPLAAFPLHFSQEDTVTAKINLQNPSDQTKTIPLQWNQYSWDSQREENRQYTQTELITLQPNETKQVAYTALKTVSSVIFITATALDGESKSIVNLRYVHDGIEETRINFPSITQFPLKEGQEQTFFACAHSTNVPVVSNNILLLTLKDREENVIAQYRYDGDIAGAMSGFGTKFTPQMDYDYVKMEASLFRDGNEMEKVEVVYDCDQIDPATCNSNNEDSSLGMNGKKFAIVGIALLGIFALIGGLIVRTKRRRQVKW